MRYTHTLLTALLLAPMAVLHAAAAQSGQTSAVPAEAPSRRELAVTKDYLHLPVKVGAQERRMRLVLEGMVVREFTIELALTSPEFFVACDVSKWRGKTLNVELDSPADPKLLASIIQANDVPGADQLYHEKYRPQFHFSPRWGWVGDPNGLVFYRGEYHLFFQYNPYATKWGNMSWGHAISKDLLHWQEHPVTLYPPKLNDWAFSGSAVVDKDNTAGFKNGPEDPIIIIFPSTGRGICLSYSTDGGRTFTEYSKNPLSNKLGGDPRVFWHEATRRWVMITCKILKFSPDAKPGSPNWLKKNPTTGFEFYSSADLKNWEYHSTLEDCWECPDLFELPLDGDRNRSKWVLMSNHTPSRYALDKPATGLYRIGSFDGRTFTPESDVLQFNCGQSYGAAQSYNMIPATDGRRINVGCSFNTTMPGMAFRQQMNFPTELRLQMTEEGVRLFAWPIREISSLYTSTRDFSQTTLSPQGTVLPGVDAELLDLSAEFAVSADTEEVGINLRGVAVTFDAKAGLLKCLNTKAPLKPVNGTIKLRLLLDRVSIEIFANAGRVYMPMAIIPLPKDENRSVAVFVKGANGRLTSLTVNTLKSAWETVEKGASTVTQTQNTSSYK
ncbi:MAG: glycoside hydrolase family 32 protein [bacterium]